MWDTIVGPLRAEFSDLADPADVTRLVVRIGLAVGLAAVLGYERERSGKTAGLRTHMIVALGVSLVVVAAQQSGMDSADVSRVVQGIFAGIGFLGAGAIIKQSGAEEVRGLTTAASIWSTAAIATAAGLGSDATAIVATVFAFIILSVLWRLEQGIDKKPTTRSTRSK